MKKLLIVFVLLFSANIAFAGSSTEAKLIIHPGEHLKDITVDGSGFNCGILMKEAGRATLTNVKVINTGTGVRTDDEAVRVGFQYLVSYGPDEDKDGDKVKDEGSQMVFEGNIVLSVGSDRAKELHRAWKNKEWGNDVKIPLFNLIMKKCAPKVLLLADETGLPSPIPDHTKPNTENQPEPPHHPSTTAHPQKPPQ